MATPSPDFKFDIKAIIESLGHKLPKKDPFAPYMVGERKHHRSPGHRSYSEMWYHPARPSENTDDWHKEKGHYEYRQGCEFLTHASFWQEVEMLTGKDASVQELRDAMNHLSREEVAAGYEHYYDKWTWDDDSERTRNLMLAFEAEHKVPAGSRIYERMAEKIAFHHNLAQINKAIQESMILPETFLIGGTSIA